MKIPEKVKIGAHEYKIEFRDDLDDENMGVCRPSKLKIFIDERLPQTQQEETFIHECLHAIVSELGRYTYNQYDEEERDVQSLSHAIYQVLKDNNLLK